MSELVRAIILGIVQGITEFLPVSSSGHLELAKYFLGDDSLAKESMLMTVTLHAATALATLVAFRKDIQEIIRGVFQKNKESIDFVFKIIVSMIPAAIIGLLFEKELDAMFHQQVLLVCAMLAVTGLLLAYSHFKGHEKGTEISYTQAIIIGIAQAIAITPGISRSGATIAVALLVGVAKPSAARFSFLMVVPLILGKMAKDLLDGDFLQQGVDVPALGVGFISAFFTGLFACLWMIQLVKRSKLIYFAVYCLLVAAGVATYYLVVS